MKRKVCVLTVIALIVVASVSGYLYCSYHPYIKIGIGGGHGMEQIHIVLSTSFNIPLAKEIDENLKEVIMWNDKVVTELMDDTMEPRDIRVSGEVVDEKTILRYEGYYTTKDGQTLEYFEEKVFDFVLVSDEELFK